MINQVVVVGKIAEDINENTEILTVEVSKKNENGDIETDLVDVIIIGALAKNTSKYCKKGDIIGIKGCLKNKIIDNERRMFLFAERITFISNKKDDFE